jgi:hypothetical protein
LFIHCAETLIGRSAKIWLGFTWLKGRPLSRILAFRAAHAECKGSRPGLSVLKSRMGTNKRERHIG